MQRAPEGRDAGRDAGEQIGAGATDRAHRAGRAVLLVVRVQDQQQIESASHHGVRLVLLARCRKHHVQDVCRVRQVVARVHERLADAVLVAVGRDRWHLREQTDRVDPVLLRAVGRSVLVEGRERADCGGTHGHRVAGLGQAAEQLLQVLVQHRVVRHLVGELLQLGGRGQLLVQQEPHDLDEVALLRQLLDRVAGVPQYALLPIQERDLALARTRVAKARVVGDGAGLGAQLANIERDFAFAADHHRQVEFLIPEGELGGLRNGLVGHCFGCRCSRWSGRNWGRETRP